MLRKVLLDQVSLGHLSSAMTWQTQVLSSPIKPSSAALPQMWSCMSPYNVNQMGVDLIKKCATAMTATTFVDVDS